MIGVDRLESPHTVDQRRNQLRPIGTADINFEMNHLAGVIDLVLIRRIVRRSRECLGDAYGERQIAAFAIVLMAVVLVAMAVVMMVCVVLVMALPAVLAMPIIVI